METTPKKPVLLMKETEAKSELRSLMLRNAGALVLAIVFGVALVLAINAPFSCGDYYGKTPPPGTCVEVGTGEQVSSNDEGLPGVLFIASILIFYFPLVQIKRVRQLSVVTVGNDNLDLASRRRLRGIAILYGLMALICCVLTTAMLFLTDPIKGVYPEDVGLAIGVEGIVCIFMLIPLCVWGLRYVRLIRSHV